MMGSTITAESVESTPVITKNGPRASSFPDLSTIPDEMLYEVVDGEIVEKTVGVHEAEIATLLIEFLAPFARAHRLGRVFGETIFRIDQSKNLQRRPDVAFVSHARWPAQRRAPKVAVWDMVPDLAIEVVSPSNTADHVQEKIHEYFQAGVSRVWVVYPRQKEMYVYASPTQIQVLQLGQDLDGGELVPGFRLPLTALFEDEPE
jgi:Uma2 family endonuclease